MVPESAAAGANHQRLDYYYILILIMRKLAALLGNRRTGMPWCPQAFAASYAQDVGQAGGSSKEMQPRWHSAAVVGHISQRCSSWQSLYLVVAAADPVLRRHQDALTLAFHYHYNIINSLVVESERSVAMRRFWRLLLGCSHQRMASSSHQLPESVEACALAT